MEKFIKKLSLSDKKMFIIAIVTTCIMLVCVSTTTALLISITGPVENIFTIGNIQIELAETTGQTYQLIPGTVIEKDPLITVKSGSEDCWLFVKIDKTTDFDEYLTFEVEDGWTLLGGYPGVYYRSVESTEEDLYFFVLADNSIFVKNTITKEKMSEISSAPTLSFKAYAVQENGFEGAADAWGLILSEGEE